MNILAFSERRKRIFFRFRVSELFLSILFCAFRALAVFPDPYETAEGYYILPEVDEKVPAYHVPLPPALKGRTLLLTELTHLRTPCTVVESDEGFYLHFVPYSRGPFRLVYGFAELENDFVPVIHSRDAALLEKSLPLEFTGHREVKPGEPSDGLMRPLTLLLIWLGSGILILISLGVWYRRAIS